MARFSVRVFSLTMLAGALAVTVACGKKQPPPAPAPPPPPPVVATPPPPPPPPPPAPQPPPPPPPAPPTEDQVFASMTLEQLNAQRPLADVFFEYDSADLSDTARAVLQKNAEWLRRWVSTTITVEGHADSRGTNEYNLALAERRASSVRDYLVSLGVPVTRMNIVSKGEEQPVCTEEAESCWSQNRRGRFIFTAK
ncbi:MAG: OmpA family protein [Acidimicrobiia bacterium]|nr:OmpA family protein [Acidimicrobiia bacterium]